MKTIGIIGGFGPEATAMFYLKLVDAFRTRNNGTQPQIILRNVPVPREMEQKLLLQGKNLDAFLPLLTDAARGLQAEGAGSVVLPCNTLHVHENRIKDAITIPFVSIIDATIEKLQRENIHRIGILGSRVTVDSNLFKKKAKDITFVRVPKRLQLQVNAGLDVFVATQESTPLRKSLVLACSFFKKKGIRHVLIACTDFHGLCPTPPSIEAHDTLDILVGATVNML